MAIKLRESDEERVIAGATAMVRLCAEARNSGGPLPSRMAEARACLAGALNTTDQAQENDMISALPTPKNEVVAQYSFYDDPDGTYSISIKVNGQWIDPLGPFDTVLERQRVFDDMMAMMRSVGAVDLPEHPQ